MGVYFYCVYTDCMFCRRSVDSGSPGTRRAGCKFLWIRLALFEKQLVKIVEHLVDNSRLVGCLCLYELATIITIDVLYF